MGNRTLVELLAQNARRAVPDEVMAPQKDDAPGSEPARTAPARAAITALARSAVADRAVSEYSF